MQQNQTGKNAAGSAGGKGSATSRASLNLGDLLLRLGGLIFIDAIAIWFALSLFGKGFGLFAVVLLLVTLLINWIYIDNRWYPARWIAPGAFLMLLMVVYPIAYTIFISFTISGDGHLLTKQQAITSLESQNYAAASAASYSWTAYRSPDGVNFKIILVNKKENKAFIGDNKGLQPYTGPTDTLPATLDGYQKLTSFQAAAAGQALQNLNLSNGKQKIVITSSTEAKELGQKYTYDSGTDAVKDNETGTVYTHQLGVFQSPDGNTLVPGFTDVAGLLNYKKVFADNNITGPFLGVFIWTMIFALLSVLFSFAVGLGVALILNDPLLPVRTLFRSIIIIPYTIPAFISALIWAGLFNIQGPIGLLGKSILGEDYSWFSDPNAAKIMLLFINTWLGYPYMMLICLGALQSIPTDMYEAANLDGANRFLQFRALTFPLLLVSVAPILIASFSFNFNNFGLVELVTKGGPADPSTTTPAGKTDILISYTYRLAFGTSQGSDFGLASAISLFIFLIVVGITAFNFRFTKRLEGVLQ